jgi:bifunctional non-homologous end joining protein LigD
VPSKVSRSGSGDALAPYRRKRHFERTPEPAGGAVPSDAVPSDAGPADPAARFVVQRHRARRLHYDVRLEIGGVLVSWAVPKGPTLAPGVRRAAFKVEDHPIEYIDFEGVIPAGEYGGGDVIVWDAGSWLAHEAGDPPDPARALESGELHVDLHGEKLRGRFVFVHTGTDDAGKQEWLLLHKRDEFAVEGWNPEDHPRSVLSGRTNDEVKADPDRMWRSDLPAARASVPLKPSAAAATPGELDQLGALASTGTWQVFGRDLRVTNLDAVLFPARPGEQPVTKRALLRYAALIAPTVLPYLTRRALTVDLPDDAPDWLPRWTDPDAAGPDAADHAADHAADPDAADHDPDHDAADHDAIPGPTRTHLVVDEPAALVWAANAGAREWHARTSRIDRPHLPSYALVDLDPGERTSWDDVLALARLHRTAFEHLAVTARPKLTGRRSIQIWVPIVRGPDFEQTRAWVERVSRTVGAVVPELVSWTWQGTGRGDRRGLARLDSTQNAIDKTLVAPYSPRPAPGAPVSAPISWDELDDPDLTPDAFTISTIIDRVAERGDLFHAVLDHPQRLPPLG